MASAAEYGLFSGNRDVLQRLASSALESADIYGVAIYDRDSNLMAVAGLQVHSTAGPPSKADVMEISSQMLRIVEPVRHAPSLDEDPYTLTGGTGTQYQPLAKSSC